MLLLGSVGCSPATSLMGPDERIGACAPPVGSAPTNGGRAGTPQRTVATVPDAAPSFATAAGQTDATAGGTGCPTGGSGIERER